MKPVAGDVRSQGTALAECSSWRQGGRLAGTLAWVPVSLMTCCKIDTCLPQPQLQARAIQLHFLGKTRLDGCCSHSCGVARRDGRPTEPLAVHLGLVCPGSAFPSSASQRGGVAPPAHAPRAH